MQLYGVWSWGLGLGFDIEVGLNVGVRFGNGRGFEAGFFLTLFQLKYLPTFFSMSIAHISNIFCFSCSLSHPLFSL